MNVLGLEHALVLAVEHGANSALGSPAEPLRVVSAVRHRSGFKAGFVVADSLAIGSAVGSPSNDENPSR